MADFVAIDGLPGPTMAAMDGPLCRKWSPMNFASTGRILSYNTVAYVFSN